MKSSRDSFYRELCFSMREYDDMIDWIMENNPSCYNSPDPEKWAVDVVHSCISSILFSEENNSNSGTGMCLAVRVSTDPASPYYRKVKLAADLLYLASPKPRECKGKAAARSLAVIVLDPLPLGYLPLNGQDHC